MVKRGRLYFVPTHTSPTEPRGRSPAAHTAAAVAPRILVMLNMTSEGKGLKTQGVSRYGFPFLSLDETQR